MYIDKKIIYVIIAIIIITGVMGFTQQKILSLLLTIPGLLIAITFHEFAHAYAADKLGDDTPRRQGRLNLNPLSHLDPVGSLMLLFAGFGWGKPVEINPRNFDSKVSANNAEAIVSFAGPLMNFILAVIFSIIYILLLNFSGENFLRTSLGIVILTLIQSTVVINVGLGVFNLLPFPPLDGSKIFINFMPYNLRRWILEHGEIFYMIFLAIWITGIAGIIISPVIQFVTNGIMWLVSSILGIFI